MLVVQASESAASASKLTDAEAEAFSHSFLIQNRRGYVPDVILATIELPEDLPVVGIGCLIQASVCRPKRDLRSESNAKEISDGLPFLGEK